MDQEFVSSPDGVPGSLVEGVLDALPFGVAVLDGGGRVVRVNRAWLDLVGITEPPEAGKWVGRSYEELWQALPEHPDDGAREAREGVASVLAGRDEQISCEVSCHGPGGEERWLRVRVSEFRHEGERGAMVIHSDVTEERRAREEARGKEVLLEESLARLQLAAAATRVALWDLDLRTDEAYFSPEWKAQIGYEDHELENRFEEWESRLHPDERVEVVKHVEDYLAGRRSDYTIEFRLRHRDGSYRWIYTRADKQLDTDGTPVRVFGCHVDITERKEAQKSEGHLRALIEQTPLAIEIHSVDGRFLTCNSAYSRISGLQGAALEAVKESYDLRKDEQLLRKGFGPLLDRLYAGETIDFETHSYSVSEEAKGLGVDVDDAGSLWLRSVGFPLKDSAGRTEAVVLMTEDISEHKQAERALRETEAKFGGFLEQSPVVFELYDTDGLLIEVNPAFEKLWNLTREDVVGKFNCLQSEQVREVGLVPHFERAFAGENVVVPDTEFDARLEEVDHRERSRSRWVSNRIYPVRDLNGKVTHVVMMHEDITERKQAEEKLRNYQQQLQALSSQLSIVEERERQRIATELHDEVGQNLALSRLQLASAIKAAADPGLTGKLTELSGTLLQATRDTRNLVYDLSSPSLHELGLKEAIAEFLEEGIGKRHGQETCFETDGEDFALSRDIKALMFRSVRELLTNVVKHAKARRVTVRMECGEGVGRITVEDDGCGFAVPETLRTSPEGGFGLFSIRERMIHMGGSLEMISEPGGGCRAVLTVPCPEPDSGTEQEPNDKEP